MLKNILTSISEANVNHYNQHPIKHTIATTIGAVGLGLVVNAVAEKMGQREIDKMMNTFHQKWS